MNAMRPAVALLFIASCSGVAAQTADPWKVWVAEKKDLIQRKDSGIKVSEQYRNRVCTLQKSDDAKADCVARLNTIVERRVKEKVLIQAMLDTMTLSNASRNALLDIVNPAYNQMDAATTDLAAKAFALYPER